METTVTLTPIEEVKKGDYFRRPGKSVVYVKGDYVRGERRYECNKFDDISAFTYLKKGTMVETDFDF